MRKFLLIIITIFISCNYISDEIKFKITNNSNFVIDSLKIQPDVNINKYINLKLDESKFYLLTIPDSIKSDGCYLLKFKINNKNISTCFGYFTNGFPLDEEIKIIIENDTIKYDYKIIK